MYFYLLTVVGFVKHAEEMTEKKHLQLKTSEYVKAVTTGSDYLFK
jgi:hypothetical protein